MRRILLALVVAGLAFAAAGTDPAGAHTAVLTVKTECQVDGQWKAYWSITNSESAKTMVIMSEDVTSFAPNPTPFSGTSTDSTTHANNVASVTATVTVDWVRHEPRVYSATALRPEVCDVPTPPTTVPPPPPPTTVPPVVTVPPVPPTPPVPPVIDTPAPAPRVPYELARTGSGLAWLALAGLVALLVGVLVVAIEWRIDDDR